MHRRELLRSMGALTIASAVPACRRDRDATVAPVDEATPDPWAALEGFCDGIAAPDEAERQGHRERAQRALHEAGVALLVVEPGATMQHLGGARWGRSERPFLLALPQRGEPWWVVPAFEERTAREQLGDARVRAWQEHESPYETLAAALAEASGVEGTVAVEPQMRHFIVEGLRQTLGAGRIIDGTAVVDEVRLRKQPAELDRLRRANEATKAALRLVASTVVRPGLRQSELAEHVRQAQLRAGLSDVWVLALFGPNASFPHGTAEDRELAEGDVVLVDTGGSLHGYRSDITRSWAPTTIDAEIAKAWSVVARAQQEALVAIRPGARCGDVDAAARAVIEQEGFGSGYAALTHRLGHGIGLEVHEAPYLVRDAQRVLEPGMTMSDEPGIYVPGRYGIRIEDIVAVTDDGHEVFGPMVTSLDEPFGPAV